MCIASDLYIECERYLVDPVLFSHRLHTNSVLKRVDSDSACDKNTICKFFSEFHIYYIY